MYSFLNSIAARDATVGIDVSFDVETCRIDPLKVDIIDVSSHRDGLTLAQKTIVGEGKQVECCCPDPQDVRCAKIQFMFEIQGPDKKVTEKVKRQMKITGNVNAKQDARIKLDKGPEVGGERSATIGGDVNIEYEWGNEFVDPGGGVKGGVVFEICPTGCHTARREGPDELSVPVGGQIINGRRIISAGTSVGKVKGQVKP